ncbi:uncharacterized protein EDB93DRAFT_1252678 [Suillus bovinus]|uniref:uncharacterized protein n=1 Tax=Suillus bovinus TaxID=48563 RepID=UPI001B85B635|nr:uncharacterized protein EDB93DRAFT_1252678 [Suillus bovinus]KAG2140893.1 hypothetical protein EDB93DRAFT_1252678 [Suillus bovinus]
MSNAEGDTLPMDESAGGLDSVSHVDHWQVEHTASSIEPQQAEGSNDHADMAVQAQQRRRIAQLEEKLVALESGRTIKERQSNYFVAQGRAIRHVVALFDSLEDLITENDQRHDVEEDAETTCKAMEQEYEEYAEMLKMVDFHNVSYCLGDDTSKLKVLISEWVNHEFKPDPPVDPDDKHARGFTNDACGSLLCPSELDWNNPDVKAGIWDRADGYIVTDLSFPAFLYKKYTAKPDDLEEGLFKGKLLLQAYKAVFTSPSSAKDVEGDGNGADVIQNNR